MSGTREATGTDPRPCVRATIRMKVPGKWVVGFVVAAGALAALGTCSRFVDERPLSRQILEWEGRRLTAEFAPDDRLVAGMMASVDLDGSRIHGRVADIVASGGRLRVVVDLDAPAAPGESPRSVMIDTTVPPDLLKPPEKIP